MYAVYSASRKISLLTCMRTRRRCRNIIACTAAEAATAAELYNTHTHIIIIIQYTHGYMLYIYMCICMKEGSRRFCVSHSRVHGYIIIWWIKIWTRKKRKTIFFVSYIVVRRIGGYNVVCVGIIHTYNIYYYYYVRRYALEDHIIYTYIYIRLIVDFWKSRHHRYRDGRSTTGAKPKKRRLDLSATVCNNFFME